ncbi:MAG TPA: hypothetical protein VJ757_01845 [Pseudonocardiaceae bacterium]|nr:hypothetical protein [Pseudonocardiaceae bacterium]
MSEKITRVGLPGFKARPGEHRADEFSAASDDGGVEVDLGGHEPPSSRRLRSVLWPPHRPRTAPSPP